MLLTKYEIISEEFKIFPLLIFLFGFDFYGLFTKFFYRLYYSADYICVITWTDDYKMYVTKFNLYNEKIELRKIYNDTIDCVCDTRLFLEFKGTDFKDQYEIGMLSPFYSLIRLKKFANNLGDIDKILKEKFIKNKDNITDKYTKESYEKMFKINLDDIEQSENINIKFISTSISLIEEENRFYFVDKLNSNNLIGLLKMKNKFDIYEFKKDSLSELTIDKSLKKLKIIIALVILISIIVSLVNAISPLKIILLWSFLLVITVVITITYTNLLRRDKNDLNKLISKSEYIGKVELKHSSNNTFTNSIALVVVTIIINIIGVLAAFFLRNSIVESFPLYIVIITIITTDIFFVYFWLGQKIIIDKKTIKNVHSN
ncbi:MAG: hypothetical protein RR585_04560 [Coprobacillus sp.]